MRKTNCVFKSLGQAVNRKMTENQTSAMIKFAATSTDVRKDKINRALREASHNTNPTVREFGFSVANEFEKLTARVLPPPDLTYKDRNVRVSKGVWRSEKFCVGQQINKWTIAVADRRAPRPDELSNMASMVCILGILVLLSFSSTYSFGPKYFLWYCKYCKKHKNKTACSRD